MPNSGSLNDNGGPPTGGNPGDVEAWALTQAALRMKDAVDSGDSDQIMAAARLNWRLWTNFQAELLDPECTVPKQIRKNLLSLANFIDQHTVSFLSDPDPGKLDVLISINREISTGLSTTPSADGEESEEPLLA